MTMRTPTTLDHQTAERLAAGFHRCFSHFEAAPGLFAEAPMIRPEAVAR